MRLPSRWVFFTLSLSVAACTNTCGRSAKERAVGTAPAPPASAAFGDAAAGRAKVTAGPLVDLLRNTDARVAVSSKVDNPHDYPEHLVDGRPETAWNGRTGDLVGAFILFSVPDDADVVTLQLSAGFDATSAKGEDLFVANHRIRKVRITRNDVLLRDALLDPNRRKPQELTVGTKGGTFKIEVLEVVAGTHEGWRELVVSELAVLGRPGTSARTSPHLPKVTVGALAQSADGRDAGGEVTGTPFSSLAAFCAGHVKSVEAFYHAHPTAYGKDQKPYCTPESDRRPVSEGLPFRAIASVTAFRPATRERVRVLFAETQAGLFEVTDTFVDRRSFESCGPTTQHHIWLGHADVINGTVGVFLLVRVVEANSSSAYGNDEVENPVENPGLTSFQQRVIACHLDGGRLECALPEIVAEASTDDGFIGASYVETPAFEDIPWTRTKKPRVEGRRVVFE